MHVGRGCAMNAVAVGLLGRCGCPEDREVCHFVSDGAAERDAQEGLETGCRELDAYLEAAFAPTRICRRGSGGAGVRVALPRGMTAEIAGFGRWFDAVASNGGGGEA